MAWYWQLVILFLASSALMTAGWLWQRARANAGIVDVLWAAGLALAALLFAALGDGAAGNRILLAVLGGIWALRLASHLWLRVRGEPEDGRYQNLRAHWKGSQGKFFLFFQFQALMVPLFSVPFLAVSMNPRFDWTWAGAAALVWVVSLLGESVADLQLAKFRADRRNRGRTCRDGLWRYSRHPNYFFEWLHWFTYVFLAIGSHLAWLACSGPVVMYVFLRWISGIPYTEAQALRSRGEDYRRYQQSTSMLFPWFPGTPD